MVKTIAVTEAITNLNDAHERLGLSRASNSAFFPQWQEPLPALSAVEQAALDKYCDRLFLKLQRQPVAQYALSNKFTLLSDEANNLHRVAQVLKRLAADL